jgi:hypothetical protein
MLNTQDEINNNLDIVVKQKAQQKLMQSQQVNPALNQQMNYGGVPSV